MAKSKRRNYLIDKPFQLGFIFKYLIVILLTVLFCFGIAALYYYQDSLLGTSKLNQVVTYSTQGHLSTENGHKIYNYDKENVQVYKIEENGGIIYKVYNPFNNEEYKKGDDIIVTDDQVEPAIGKVTRTTNRFTIIIFPLIWSCLAIMVIISIFSLFFSHRMAGPVYRLRVSLDRMLAGDYDFKIRVRKNDFFRNIVDKLDNIRLQLKNNSSIDSSNKND